MIDGFALPFFIHAPVPVAVSDHVGHKGGIDHEFADPVAFWLLLAKKIILGPPDGGFQIRQGERFKIGGLGGRDHLSVIKELRRHNF